MTTDPSSAFEPQTPYLSVITTVLNCERYLAEAIDSVLAQHTDAPWEMLIVDDGSVDASLLIAQTYAARFADQIFVLQHPGGVNRGISSSRNLALRHARGEVIAFLDADDVWLPDKLSLQLPLLRSMPEVAMVYASAERWCDFSLPYDPEVGSLGDNFLPPLIPAHAIPGILHPPQLLTWFRADESMAPCTCTALVRTAVARRLGGFVDRFEGLYDDQAFFAKLALTEFVFVSLDCVARYRQHPESCCARARQNAAARDAQEAAFEQWLSVWLAEKTSETRLEALSVAPSRP